MNGNIALLEHHLTCRRELDPGRQPFDQRGPDESFELPDLTGGK